MVSRCCVSGPARFRRNSVELKVCERGGGTRGFSGSCQSRISITLLCAAPAGLYKQLQGVSKAADQRTSRPAQRREVQSPRPLVARAGRPPPPAGNSFRDWRSPQLSADLSPNAGDPSYRQQTLQVQQTTRGHVQRPLPLAPPLPLTRPVAAQPPPQTQAHPRHRPHRCHPEPSPRARPTPGCAAARRSRRQPAPGGVGQAGGAR